MAAAQATADTLSAMALDRRNERETLRRESASLALSLRRSVDPKNKSRSTKTVMADAVKVHARLGEIDAELDVLGQAARCQSFAVRELERSDPEFVAWARRNVEITREYNRAEQTANSAVTLDGSVTNHKRWHEVRNNLIASLADKVKAGRPID